MKGPIISIPLSALLLASLFWGFNNHQKFRECQQANQELIGQLKKTTSQTWTETSSLEEGDRLKEAISLSQLDGQSWILEPELPTILIFISTTCPACLETALQVFSEASKFQPQGLQIISVSRDPAEDLSQMVRQRNWPMAVVLDRRGRLYRLFRVSAEPFLVLIDRGHVRLKIHALAIDRRLPELHEYLNRNLSASREVKSQPVLLRVNF